MLWSLNQDTGKIGFILRSLLWMCVEREKRFFLPLLLKPPVLSYWVLTTSFNLNWHLSGNLFLYSWRESPTLFMGSQTVRLCKEKIEHMPCRSHSKCNGLRNLTYEFWGDTIQPIQRIIKKKETGASINHRLPLFWLLLWGEFTPSTSNVASLRAEQFPAAEEEQSGALMKATWCKMAEKTGLWGN